MTLSSKRHWIMFAKSLKGEIFIDRGAEKAITQNGKSLLPAGIKEVRGNFREGDSVMILNEEGKELGIGIVNYSSSDIRKIAGAKSSEIENILGFKYTDEVIHRDNMVLKYQIEEEDEWQIKELRIQL